MLPISPLLKDLTEDQLRIYNLSFDRKRLLVSGEPGTGKSTLIGLSIRDYIKEKKSSGEIPVVDFITFNKNLAAFNGDMYSIVSDTYLSWLNKKTGFINRVITENPTDNKWKAFFAMEPSLKNSIIGAIDSSGIPKGKFLCIDEGQDIPPIAYEKFAEMYESIYVFMDGGQIVNGNLESSSEGFVRQKLNIPGTDYYYLNQNFRNTREIYDAFHPLRQALTGDDTVPPRKKGIKPKTYVLTADEQISHIEKICSEKKPSTIWNIGIIAKTKIEQDQIYDRLTKILPNKIQLCQSSKETINYGNFSIFVLNTSNVKGLEFHEVILVGVDDSWKERNQLYIAATRTSDLLHVQLKSDSVLTSLGLSQFAFERAVVGKTEDVIEEVEF